VNSLPLLSARELTPLLPFLAFGLFGAVIVAAILLRRHLYPDSEENSRRQIPDPIEQAVEQARKEGAARSARRIIATRKHVYTPRHDIRPANPADFEGLDMEFYQAAQRTLETFGFLYLGDVEDSTMTAFGASRHRPTFMRNLTHPADGIIAGICHFRHWDSSPLYNKEAPGRHDLRIVEFDSPLTDGTTVTTSNAANLASMDEISGRSRRLLPDGTPVEEVLARHREHLLTVLADKPGVSPFPIRTLGEAIDNIHRGIERGREHYRRVGWYTREEYFRSGRAAGNSEEWMERVWKDIEALQREERGEAETPRSDNPLPPGYKEPPHSV